jgi:hypothetical protein
MAEFGSEAAPRAFGRRRVIDLVRVDPKSEKSLDLRALFGDWFTLSYQALVGAVPRPEKGTGRESFRKRMREKGTRVLCAMNREGVGLQQVKFLPA